MTCLRRRAGELGKLCGLGVVALALLGAVQATTDGPRVKIVAPAAGSSPANPLSVQALVVAGDAPVSTVRLFVNDALVGERDRPPYAWTHEPGDAPLVAIRVVAVDSAGNEATDELILYGGNAPRFGTDVEAVLVPLTVEDRHGRPVSDLRPEEITVWDHGVRQEDVRVLDADAPLRVLVLFDHSSSMRGKMATMLAALEAFCDALRDGDEILLAGFSDSVRELTDFTDRLDMIPRLARGLRASGGTAMYDAIVYGTERLEILQGADHRLALFVFSDGDDRGSANAPMTVLPLLRQSPIPIFAVAQGNAFEDADLRRNLAELVEQGGGKVVFEKDADRAPAAFASIARRLRAMYVVSFVPSRSGDEGWHDLRIEVAREGTTTWYRDGYLR